MVGFNGRVYALTKGLISTKKYNNSTGRVTLSKQEEDATVLHAVIAPGGI